MKTKAKARRRQQQHKHRPRPRHAPAPAPTTTAIIKHPTTERTLKPQEIDLLKKTVAKNCSDEEFSLFMLVCKKKKLDPFTKQVYAIKWPRRDEPDEMVIIVGIGGYRSMAARSHKRDFGGTSEPTWTFNDPSLGKTPAGRKIPDTASVKAFRKGGVHVGAATVFWEEFAPPNLKEKRADFWNRMPKHMLAKCAESHALRKCFPDLSDIYSEEEMSQRLADLTPGGRQISHAGVAPSGKILDQGEEQGRVNAKLVAEAKKRGDWCEQHHCVRMQCPADEHTQQENDEVWERHQEGRTIDVKPTKTKTEKAKPHGIPEGAELLSGTIHRIIHGTVRNTGAPMVSVRVNNVWHNCYSKTINEFFRDEAVVVARVIEFYVDKAKAIVGLKRIGTMSFQPDGRTPIRREPGEEQ